jgi:hypothetical protein
MGLVRKILPLLGVFAALTGTAVPALAVEATLVADAHVNSALPAVNSGAISNLRVGGGYTSLLQFDLSLLPSGTTAAQVSRAVLRLYCNRVDTGGLVSVQPVNGAWGEYSVTYGTLPMLGSAAQVVSVSQAGTYVAVDVTALVQGWITTPSSNNGVALTAGTAAVQFDSKENDLTGHAAVLDVALVGGGSGSGGTVGPVGPQGPAGPVGATGPAGPAGPPGPQGISGGSGLNFQGVYGSTINYGLGDVVTFSGSSYVSLIASNHGNTPGVSPQQWGVLAQGASGGSGSGSGGGGVGVAYQGTYGSTANYGLNDVVFYQGSSYISLVAGNHGNSPDLSPAWWGLLAQGAVGTTGATGATGPAGPQGAVGLTGPAGPPGPQGVAGAAGAPGKPGLVYQGAYSSVMNYALGDVVLWQGASWASLMDSNHGNTPDQSPGQWGMLTAQGPVGATGLQGPQGLPGMQGLPGSVGPPGETGPQGLQGIPGQAGAQGLTGPAGPQGLQGPMGPQGEAGPVGMTFRGAYSSGVNYAIADGVIYGGAGYVSLVDGNHGNTPDLSPGQWALFASGGAGPAGPPGAVGPQGPAGAQGPQGFSGATGPQGPQGAQGPAVANYTGNYSSATNYGLHDAVSFAGATYVSLVAGNLGHAPDVSPGQWAVLAAQGPAGPAGTAGAAGPQGPAGAAGAQGAVGPAGPPVSFAGTWLAGQAYGVGAAVGFGGTSYVALVANVGRQPDVSPAYWAVLAQGGAAGAPGATGAMGPQGPAGAVGVSYKGAWVAGSGYVANDAVLFGGTTYLALVTSLGSRPDVSPAAWAVLAAAGVDGATGPAGAAATVSVGTVTTGAAGSQASVTNSGTANATVLNFTIPQGAPGVGGSGGGGGGGTSGIPFASMYHSVSFNFTYYSVNNSNSSASETASVLTWVPTGCTASTLTVFSQQSNTITVTLRQGTPGNMVATGLSCAAASGGSCTATGSETVAAGNFVDLSVSGASGTGAGVWTAVACN